MKKLCKAGDWVEVRQVILEAEDRPENVPDDTKKTPLVAWVKGWAQSPASLGEDAEIRTYAGRKVKGRLTDLNPGYDHTYGPIVPELASVAQELRDALKGAVKNEG